ncbi:MAG: sulfatase-like hydrolase/transferase, partial [Gammaproteobacteria bacterium]|nr:sulfatase-like hydrolase/transferase [Gammaproteobacteria bacterium]
MDGRVRRGLTRALRWPVAWSWCAVAAAAAGQELPNIVIIVPDDLGRYDVSMHGGDIATPNIDSIARDGVLLSRFYTAPVCSPTRAGLMTGRYPIRSGLMRSVVRPPGAEGVPPHRRALYAGVWPGGCLG